MTWTYYSKSQVTSFLYKEESLNIKVAKSLFEYFGKPDKDPFASHMNNKCFKYVSYIPDPNEYQVGDIMYMNIK